LNRAQAHHSAARWDSRPWRSAAVGGQAEPHGVEALVVGELLEERRNARGLPLPDHFLERLLHRVRDEIAANVEVAHEPARRQRVDERDRGVREERQRDQQRHEESKGEAHARASAGWAVDGTPIVRLRCNKPYPTVTRAAA
jgi:hypothetical protein